MSRGPRGHFRCISGATQWQLAGKHCFYRKLQTGNVYFSKDFLIFAGLNFISVGLIIIALLCLVALSGSGRFWGCSFQVLTLIFVFIMLKIIFFFWCFKLLMLVHVEHSTWRRGRDCVLYDTRKGNKGGKKSLFSFFYFFLSIDFTLSRLNQRNIWL